MSDNKLVSKIITLHTNKSDTTQYNNVLRREMLWTNINVAGVDVVSLTVVNTFERLKDDPIIIICNRNSA